MNQLIQLIQSQERPVVVVLFFDNGLSIKLDNVKVFSGNFLVGTNNFQGKSFVPIKHICGYSLSPYVKKDKKSTREDNMKESNIQERETSKMHSSNSTHTNYPYRPFYNDYIKLKEEGKKDPYVDPSQDKNFLDTSLAEHCVENAVNKGADNTEDKEVYETNFIESDIPSPKKFESSNPLKKINNIPESQQTKPKNGEDLSALDNIKMSSINGNSVIKDSGKFTNKGKG